MNSLRVVHVKICCHIFCIQFELSVIQVADAGMLGKASWSGFNEMRHSLAPVVSRQPERIGCCWGLYTITASLVNSTRQSASQILPIPKRVCLNDGMTWPVLGKVAGRNVSL